MVVEPIPGIWWSTATLNGQREFPTNKQKGDGSFKDILDDEMEKLKKKAPKNNGIDER